MNFLELVTIVVDDYDPAIAFFVDVLGFELIEDFPSLTNDGFFLRVEDFEATYNRMVAAGVQFVTQPRTEPYGRLAVVVDLAGNKWDLLGEA